MFHLFLPIEHSTLSSRGFIHDSASSIFAESCWAFLLVSPVFFSCSCCCLAAWLVLECLSCFTHFWCCELAGWSRGLQLQMTLFCCTWLITLQYIDWASIHGSQSAIPRGREQSMDGSWGLSQDFYTITSSAFYCSETVDATPCSKGGKSPTFCWQQGESNNMNVVHTGT